jgi:hypothetical protein
MTGSHMNAYWYCYCSPALCDGVYRSQYRYYIFFRRYGSAQRVLNDL